MVDVLWLRFTSFLGNSVCTILGGTLRSHHRTFVDFDKICVFCGKCYVCIDICVFIVIKIKCVNSGRICDICDKVNFTTKLHIFYNTWQTFIKIQATFYQNTNKYYKFWHVWWDSPVAGPKNLPNFRPVKYMEVNGWFYFCKILSFCLLSQNSDHITHHHEKWVKKARAVKKKNEAKGKKSCSLDF